MKLVVIGFGQCGGRIADEFTRLNRRARGHRAIEIITESGIIDSKYTAWEEIKYAITSALLVYDQLGIASN